MRGVLANGLSPTAAKPRMISPAFSCGCIDHGVQFMFGSTAERTCFEVPHTTNGMPVENPGLAASMKTSLRTSSLVPRGKNSQLAAENELSGIRYIPRALLDGCPNSPIPVPRYKKSLEHRSDVTTR